MSNHPRHVAIIMDGNGRWAQRRHHPRVFGHVRGAYRLKQIIAEANRLKLGALTVFAFSTENWSRPEGELRVLWSILKKFLTRDIAELNRGNVSIHFIGEVEKMSDDVKAVIANACETLKRNTGLKLTIALSYGSRAELVRATREFARDCVAGKRRPDEISDEVLEKYLWTSQLGDHSDVDLVIRTSGERRVSNFLLWQSAYAEYVFVDRCWPDFGVEQFREALHEFSTRERRFGNIQKVEAELRSATHIRRSVRE